MKIQEEKIINELKNSNEKTFEYVFNTYYVRLCRYAEEIIKDSQESEDIVVNCFIKIWENRKNLSIHTSIRSYLYKSIYNACLNIIRKRKLEYKYSIFFINNDGYSKAHDYGSLSYPLSELIEKELVLKVERVIDELPHQCKKVFLLSRVDNFSHKEIAERLDISVNTVKSHVMNALQKLQSALKEE